jgi:hypothetical protein
MNLRWAISLATLLPLVCRPGLDRHAIVGRCMDAYAMHEGAACHLQHRSGELLRAHISVTLVEQPVERTLQASSARCGWLRVFNTTCRRCRARCGSWCPTPHSDCAIACSCASACGMMPA